MPRPLPPASWLRTFEVAAGRLSFTRAAEQLHVTQSAVSQQIRLLEDRLGQALFHRLPQSLQLTDAGRAYLPVVRDAFEQLTLGTEQLFGHTGGQVVTIRSTPGFGEFWLAPRLGAFFAEEPAIDVRIVSMIWNTDALEAGVDLEIRYGLDEWGELATRRLTDETLTPVCSPALAEQLGGDPARLADVRLLHVDGFRDGWSEWLHYAGIGAALDGGSGCHFDTAILPLRLAEDGLGVALGRHSLIERRLQTGHLVAPLDLPMPVDEAFYVTWSADRTLGDEAAALRDWLLRMAATTAQR